MLDLTDETPWPSDLQKQFVDFVEAIASGRDRYTGRKLRRRNMSYRAALLLDAIEDRLEETEVTNDVGTIDWSD